MTHPQTIVALDMEGVLVPEIWIAVAERTGIDALRRTTRDEPDYDVLMRYRLDLLDRARPHAAADPGRHRRAGAAARRRRLHRRAAPARAQVVVLSDTFEQFAEPLVRQLGWPTILCHRLEVADDRIIGYRLRMPDQKRAAVEAFRSLEYRVLAAGDSYNDTSMLLAADAGFLFHAPPNVVAEFPQLPSFGSHAELLAAMFPAGLRHRRPAKASRT